MFQSSIVDTEFVVRHLWNPAHPFGLYGFLRVGIIELRERGGGRCLVALPFYVADSWAMLGRCWSTEMTFIVLDVCARLVQSYRATYRGLLP